MADLIDERPPRRNYDRGMREKSADYLSDSGQSFRKFRGGRQPDTMKMPNAYSGPREPLSESDFEIDQQRALAEQLRLQRL